MAGSYSHATTDDHKLRNFLNMGIATETHGDAYETIEEMYGMIWFLAKGNKKKVEKARKKYRKGIEMSPGYQLPGEIEE
jgi:hypothetical protein